jgi:hypothetical protein
VELPAASDSTSTPSSARMRQSKRRYSCNTVACFPARVTSRADCSSHPSEAKGEIDLRVKNSYGDLEPASDDGGEAAARLLTEALGNLGVSVGSRSGPRSMASGGLFPADNSQLSPPVIFPPPDPFEVARREKLPAGPACKHPHCATNSNHPVFALDPLATPLTGRTAVS